MLESRERTRPRFVLAAALIEFVGGAVAPIPAAAQVHDRPPSDGATAAVAATETARRLFPGSFVVRPLAGSSTGIDIGGGPVYVRRDPPAGSGGVSPEANAAFGYRLPLYRFRDGGHGGPPLDLGIEAGVLARFALGEGHNGLINADFRVALPAGGRLGRWEGILALVHVSSHLGDDFLEQTPGFQPGAISRNGFEADLLYRLATGLRGYAGGDYNFATAGVETFAGRLGLDYHPPTASGRALRPLGSVELEMTDLTHRTSATATAGIGIRTGSGELRLGLAAHAGPSRMGQFRTVDETYVGLFLSVLPGVVARSGPARP